MTSLASTTTVKEGTTETPTTARDETTMVDRPTTSQTTTSASLPHSTTTQQQMKTTTKEGTEALVAGHTSPNYVITTMIGETTSSLAAQTTKEVSSFKGIKNRQ